MDLNGKPSWQSEEFRRAKEQGHRARVCLFVCGISLTSGQLIIELFPDCPRSSFSQVVLRRRDTEPE